MPNQVNKNTIAKNTIALYFRMLFTMAVGFYTSRVILNALGVTDYGINNVVGGIVTMFTFLNGAMSLTTSRHLTYALGENNLSKLRDTFKAGITVHCIIALIVLLSSETIGLWFLYNKMIIPMERLDAALWVFHLSILGTVIGIVAVPYNSAVVAHEKISAYAWMSIIDVSMKLLICFMLTIVLFDKLKIYAVLYFITGLLNVSFYVIYCRTKFSEARFGLLWEKNLLKDISSFAGWTLFGQLAYMGFTQGLNMLLNVFFGPSVNAARGIAVQVQGLVYKFISSFQTAFNPQLTKTYAGNQISEMHKLIYMSSKFSYFLILIISLPVILKTHWLLVLWLKIVPDYTVEFFRIIIFVSYLETLSYPLVISAMATGDVKKYNIVVGSILLLIVPISYIALKMGADPIAVFYIHLLCATISQIIRLVMLRQMIRLSIRQYAKDVVLPISIVTVISFSICVFVETYFTAETISNFIIVSAISVAVAISCIAIFGLSTNEKKFLKNLILKKLPIKS